MTDEDEIDDALEHAKYNFEGVITGFRVQAKERAKKQKKRENKKPKEYKHLILFASHYLSEEIERQCHAYGDYNHATIWAHAFLNEMVSKCKERNFENFTVKSEIPVKDLMEEACCVLSDDVMDIQVSCKAHLREKNASPHFDITLKY